MGSQRPQNITVYCQYFLLISRSLWLNTIDEDTMYLNHRTQRNQAGIHVEASSLLPSFHGPDNTYYTTKKKIIIYFISL